MPEPKRPLKVFLSYASQDKPVVRELSGRLSSEGWIDPWVDEKKLLPGQDWRTKIEEAVETSDIVIICLSNNSVTKEGFVQKELRYAREIAFEKPDETIFLIPLRLDDCTVPRGLRFYQWGDYFGENKEETYSALLESLKLRHEQKLKIETEEYIRREKAEKERIVLEEKARKEAEEKARLEEAERARRERDERERKAAEANVRKEAEEKARRVTEERALVEKAEKERIAAETALQEKKKLEVAQKAKREKEEREAAERNLQEKLKRDNAEKSKRERAERQTAQLAALSESLFKSFTALKSNLSKIAPFLKTAGFIGIAIALLWAGSWAVPKFISFIPTPRATATITQRPTAQIISANSPIPPTEISKPSATPTELIIPTSTSLPTEITDAKGVSMVLVPAGDFMMGHDAGLPDQRPVHKVYLDAFLIDEYETSNAEYLDCVNASFCLPPQFAIDMGLHPESPVRWVDWNQANRYCNWRNANLPTEAQWEKAARGTDERSFPWGEDIDCTKAAFKGCNENPFSVGSFKRGISPYGVYDMAGNVWEWVADWYSETYYQDSPPSNPVGPVSGDYRVLRGGSYLDGAFYLHVYYRDTKRIIDISTIGFRCAKDANS